MIPEREQWDGDRGGVPKGPYADRTGPLFERKQTYPFVTKGRLASGLTIQDAIARRRERR